MNFECKTSDKLSRKAYPKGYTSSLEERVRELEGEIRLLKDLLDKKDEKIDILSKMRRPSAGPLGSPTPPASTPSDHGREDSFRVHQTPCLYGKETGPQFFMGASSSRGFVDVFKTKLQEAGKLSIPFEAATLFPPPSTSSPKSHQQPVSPPRMVSDQLINVFFQEWAPLLPVLHRPTFLRIYEGFISKPILKDPRLHAQMYLVFGIAALSSMTNLDLLPMYEVQWRKALDAAAYDTSLETLQALVLAQIYSIIKGEHQRLLHYSGAAVRMAHRLGLHQSQKPFNFEALKTETRKKVFWALYAVDCFAAVSLGLPRLLRDTDIETEDPADIDDENVSERGFQATLPGEHTKISSALALFRASRLLAKVLDEVYPIAGSRDVSLSRVASLVDELDSWRDALPAHLRLEFVQDKVNFNVTSDRSPLLALVYFHVRSCIYRPVVAANIGDKGITSVIALADASKRIYQISKLLEQRQVSFTLPINRTEILSLAGIGLLYQAIELRSESKLIQENQKLVASIAELLSRTSKPASTTLVKISCILPGQEASPPPNRRSTPEGSMSPPRLPEGKASPRDQLQAIAARFSLSNSRNQKRSSQEARRATAPSPPIANDLGMYSRSGSHASQGSVKSEPISTVGHENPPMTLPYQPSNLANLDFFPMGSQPTTPDPVSLKQQPNTAACDWDQLVNQYQTFDSHTPTGHYSTGTEFLGSDTFSAQISPSALTSLDWSPNAWNLLDASVSSTDAPSATAQSVFSLSEESLTSTEDLSSCDLGSDYPGFAMPVSDEFANFPEFGVSGDFHNTNLRA